MNLNIREVLDSLQESFELELNKSVIDVFNHSLKNVLQELEISVH